MRQCPEEILAKTWNFRLWGSGLVVAYPLRLRSASFSNHMVHPRNAGGINTSQCGHAVRRLIHRVLSFYVIACIFAPGHSVSHGSSSGFSEPRFLQGFQQHLITYYFCEFRIVPSYCYLYLFIILKGTWGRHVSLKDVTFMNVLPFLPNIYMHSFNFMYCTIVVYRMLKMQATSLLTRSKTSGI